VQAFAAAYPEIVLELSSNERIVDLMEQRVDIAIRIGALQDSTLHARSLGSSRLRILASPGYLAERGEPRTVAELRRHRLIGFTAPESLNEWPLIDDDFAIRDTGARFRVVPEIAASSGETMRQLALAGGGVVCLAAYMTSADVASGRLQTVMDPVLLDVRQPVSAVFYQSASMAGRAKAFLDFIAGRLVL